jgi:hypothetical protein
MVINRDIPFEDYYFAFGRFEEEKPPYYFEYKKKTPFGRGMSMDEILENHSKLQSYCREKGLNY